MTDASATAVSAVVLAGGRSSRFGREKLSADVAGSPLLHAAIRAVAPVVDEVVLAGAATGLAVEAPADLGVPVEVVLDARPGQGPLVALITAARAASGELLLVVGGDMFDLQRPLLERLLRPSDGRDGVCITAGGWVQPLPVALVRSRALEVGRPLADDGERSLRRLLDALRMDVLDEQEWRPIDPDARSLLDIDTPADLELTS